MQELSRRAALALPLATLPLTAQGQDWKPTQQVRLLVAAAPGGTTDIMARLLSPRLQARWGISVVAENRAGAGGTICTLEMVRSRPDGTTIMSGNIGPQAIAYSLVRNLPYRQEQVLPIAGTITGPNVLVVNKDEPATSVAELAAMIRARPGQVSYASTGVGQSTHLSPVLMLQMLNGEAIHVPFRGSGPAQVDLLAGNVNFLIDNLTGVIEHIRAGRVRALAVTSRERSSQLPDVPTMQETMPELANYEVNTWFGIFGPAGMPNAMVRAINAEVNAWLDLPDTQRRFAELGGVPLKLSPEAFADFVTAETRKWAAVVQREGLQVEAG